MTRALKREASGIVFMDSWRRVDPEQCSTLAGPGGAYDRTAIAIGVVRGGVAHGCGAIREMAQESPSHVSSAIAMTTTTSTTPYGARKTHAGNTRPTASWGSRRSKSKTRLDPEYRMSQTESNRTSNTVSEINGSACSVTAGATRTAYISHLLLFPRTPQYANKSFLRLI